MNEFLYIAVDLGAGSGRVFLAGVAPGELLLEEVHRFYYPPREADGNLRWDFSRILAEIKAGLKRAGARARELKRTVRSIGVDSWAVDHGFIDADGNLLADPICYRDERTAGVMKKVFAGLAAETIFEKTGIQFLPFNTIFQLSAENAVPEPADKMLLIPDLINYELTGRAVTEYTNATTTQLVNAESGTWDAELPEAAGIPRKIFTEIVPCGTDLGKLKSGLEEEFGLTNTRVIAPATHDTASAVIGAPLKKDWAYISSGTWSLVGVERENALINDEVRRYNFTNEGGAYGTFRFLKNVAGLWLLESCRREWGAAGGDLGALLEDVEQIEGFCGFIYPDDERFLNPASMTAAINEQLRETGQNEAEGPEIFAKIILDSLAFRYCSVVRAIEKLTGDRIGGVQIVGGGSRNGYLNQMTADASGLTVAAGPVEATVIGNAMAQAIAAGRFDSLERARLHVTQNTKPEEFQPRTTEHLAAASAAYKKIERSFVSF